MPQPTRSAETAPSCGSSREQAQSRHGSNQPLPASQRCNMRLTFRSLSHSILSPPCPPTDETPPLPSPAVCQDCKSLRYGMQWL